MLQGMAKFVDVAGVFTSSKATDKKKGSKFERSDRAASAKENALSSISRSMSYKKSGAPGNADSQKSMDKVDWQDHKWGAGAIFDTSMVSSGVLGL